MVMTGGPETLAGARDAEVSVNYLRFPEYEARLPPDFCIVNG
jgi:hypothetical protein